jgi:hypothetical protein
MKAQKLSELEANRILKLIITGWNINRISYHVSGWEIRFISPSNEKPDEVCLWASDVTIPNVNLWRDKFEGLSTELNNTFEPDDTLVAIHLMSVINTHNVETAFVDSAGNLYLKFSNSTSVICNSEVDQVDWAWQIFDAEKTFTITCDSGPVYLSGDFKASE